MKTTIATLALAGPLASALAAIATPAATRRVLIAADSNDRDGGDFRPGSRRGRHEH